MIPYQAPLVIIYHLWYFLLFLYQIEALPVLEDGWEEGWLPMEQIHERSYSLSMAEGPNSCYQYGGYGFGIQCFLTP
jgi:hypothetical protein